MNSIKFQELENRECHETSLQDFSDRPTLSQAASSCIVPKLLGFPSEHAPSLLGSTGALPQPRRSDLAPQAVANIIFIRCVNCKSLSD